MFLVLLSCPCSLHGPEAAKAAQEQISASEQEIAKELKALDAQITTIIVAHRFTTLKDCDHIYELINGQVIYRGNYDDIS